LIIIIDTLSYQASVLLHSEDLIFDCLANDNKRCFFKD